MACVLDMKYAKSIFLILGEWLRMKPADEEQEDIFEIYHRWRKKSYTIFWLQYK